MIGRGDDVDDEAVHAEQMGDAAPLVAELARGRDVDRGGLHRDRDHLSAADLLLRSVLGVPPVVEEVGGALLMDDVEERPADDEQRHDDDIGLHDGR